MLRILRLSTAALFALALGAAPPQDQPKRRALTLRVQYDQTVTRRAGDTWSASDETQTWSMNATAVAEIPDLDLANAENVRIEYRDGKCALEAERRRYDCRLLSLAGNASISLKSASWRTGTAGSKATQSATHQGQGTVREGRATFCVQIVKGKVMTLDFTSGLFPVSGHKTWNDPDNKSAGSYDFDPGEHNLCTPPWPRESRGGWTVNVSRTDSGHSGTASRHERHGDENRGSTTEATLSFTLDFGTAEEVDLVLEIQDYETWLPEGAADGKAGNLCVIDAKLVAPDGRPSTQRAKRITFELRDVSSEPGSCLNAPRDPPAPEKKDLRFESDRNAGLRVIDPEEQKAETKMPDLPGARAVASCFDYGAWGTLRAKALLSGEREIVGHLKGDKGMTDIPLPKRRPDSKVADSWKKETGVADLKENDDEEDVPAGDPAMGGHKGDGLTLYEEYRGFYAGGAHVRCHPKKKDVFIVDEIGERSKDGIVMFRALTGLVVRDRITNDETKAQGKGRIVNPNRGSHNRGTSYAIRILAVERGGAAFGCGVPGQARWVEMSQAFGTGPDAWNQVRVGRAKIASDHYSASLAHELLHCCGVPHHGDGDLIDAVGNPLTEWAPRTEPDGRRVVVENGTTVVEVRTEGGAPHRIDAPVKVYLAAKHGQHSGFEDCVMRYDTADAYVSERQANLRTWVAGDEMTGIGLCDDARGTGVNAAGRAPEPRHGDARNGRCKRRVCVNDAIPH